MRSDNLRVAPSWVTPNLVGRILALAMPADVKVVPVVQVPTPGVKPKLEIVSETSSLPLPVKQPGRKREVAKGEAEAVIPTVEDGYRTACSAISAPGTVSPTVKPPVTHSRRPEECEAGNRGPTSPASPRRNPSKPRSTDAAANVEPPSALHTESTAAGTGTASSPGKAVPAREALCEVEQAAICRPADPAPSREPAVHASPQPRAQPIVVGHMAGAPRYVNYAQRMNAAVAFLRARNFTVQRHSREEIIARWHVSGWNGLFSNEQLIALAEHHGLELRA